MVAMVEFVVVEVVFVGNEQLEGDFLLRIHHNFSTKTIFLFVHQLFRLLVNASHEHKSMNNHLFWMSSKWIHMKIYSKLSLCYVMPFPQEILAVNVNFELWSDSGEWRKRSEWKSIDFHSFDWHSYILIHNRCIRQLMSHFSMDDTFLIGIELKMEILTSSVDSVRR